VYYEGGDLSFQFELADQFLKPSGHAVEFAGRSIHFLHTRGLFFYSR
jgi:hypothetical protein